MVLRRRPHHPPPPPLPRRSATRLGPARYRCPRCSYTRRTPLATSKRSSIRTSGYSTTTPRELQSRERRCVLFPTPFISPSPSHRCRSPLPYAYFISSVPARARALVALWSASQAIREGSKEKERARWRWRGRGGECEMEMERRARNARGASRSLNQRRFLDLERIRPQKPNVLGQRVSEPAGSATSTYIYILVRLGPAL